MLRAICVLSVLLVIGVAAVLRLSPTGGEEAPPGTLPGSATSPVLAAPDLEVLRGRLAEAMARAGPERAPEHAALDANGVLRDFLASQGGMRRLRTAAAVFWDPAQEEALRTIVAGHHQLPAALKLALEAAALPDATPGPEFQSAAAMRTITEALAGDLLLAVRDGRVAHAAEVLKTGLRFLNAAVGSGPGDRQILLECETTLLHALGFAWRGAGVLPPQLHESYRRLADAGRLRKLLRARLNTDLAQLQTWAQTIGVDRPPLRPSATL